MKQTKQQVFNEVLNFLEEYMRAEVSDWVTSSEESRNGQASVTKTIEQHRKEYQEAGNDKD